MRGDWSASLRSLLLQTKDAKQCRRIEFDRPPESVRWDSWNVHIVRHWPNRIDFIVVITLNASWVLSIRIFFLIAFAPVPWQCYLLLLLSASVHQRINLHESQMNDLRPHLWAFKRTGWHGMSVIGNLAVSPTVSASSSPHLPPLSSCQLSSRTHR